MRRSRHWQRLLDMAENTGLLHVLPGWLVRVVLGIPGGPPAGCLSNAEVEKLLGL